MFAQINPFGQKYFHAEISARSVFFQHTCIFSVSNIRGLLDREKSQVMDGIVKLFKSMIEQCNSSLRCHALDQGFFLLC